MRIRFLIIGFALALTSTSVYGQTSSDLEKKYGTPVKAFEVHRGVLLLAKYAESGQVCEMVLENRHKTESGFDLDEMLTDDVLERLIDELVPASERGRRDSSYGWSMALGQSTQTNYSYENVEIISGGVRSPDKVEKNMVILIRWKNRQCKQK